MLEIIFTAIGVLAMLVTYPLMWAVMLPLRGIFFAVDLAMDVIDE